MAETLVRDRFQGKATRKLLDIEAATRGATEVTASAPLILSDLRTAYEQTDADGLVYSSRLTGRTCICVYDRALPGVLAAKPLVEVTRLAGFVDALRELNVSLIATP